MFPPFIKSGVRNVEVADGQTTMLKCDVIGNPIPSVYWYREGEFADVYLDC